MYLLFTKSIAVGLFLLLLNGCTISPPVPEQKWVPYPWASSSLPFAFVLVLESKEVACASQANREACSLAWDGLPSGNYSTGQEEVYYIADHHGKGSQRVRMSKASHCAIVREPNDTISCREYWRHFVRKKINENT